jgi:repressor LexA
MTVASPRQRELLQVIQRHVEAKGWPPSYVELRAALGLSSSNAVADLVRACVSKGLLEREPRRARGLRVTEAGRAEVLGG